MPSQAYQTWLKMQKAVKQEKYQNAALEFIRE